MIRSRTRRAGAALIIAMWALTLLSLLVFSLAYQMELEARLASARRKQFKAEKLALAGMEWAKFMLSKSQRGVTDDSEYDEDFKMPIPEAFHILLWREELSICGSRYLARQNQNHGVGALQRVALQGPGSDRGRLHSSNPNGREEPECSLGYQSNHCLLE